MGIKDGDGVLAQRGRVGQRDMAGASSRNSCPRSMVVRA